MELIHVILFLSGLCRAHAVECNANDAGPEETLLDKASVSLLQLGLQMNGGHTQTHLKQHRAANTKEIYSAHPKKISQGPLADGVLEKVFYINLDSETDRNVVMQEQLRATAIPFERVSALTQADASRMPTKFFDHGFNPQLNTAASYPNETAFREHHIACYISQRMLWERIAQSASGKDAERKLYLILEDDVELPHGWADRMMSVLKSPNISADWAAIRFNTFQKTRPEDLVENLIGNHNGLYRPSLPWMPDGPGRPVYYQGNHAVLVSAASAVRLLNYMDSIVKTNVDVMFVSAPGSYVIMDCGLPHETYFSASVWEQRCGSGAAGGSSSVAKADSGLSQSEEKKEDKDTFLLQDSSITSHSEPTLGQNYFKKNRIVMEMGSACQGTTFIMSTVKKLIRQHGGLVWSPMKEVIASNTGEKQITGTPYCTEGSGQHQKVHRWDSNSDPIKRLQAAWNVMSGRVTCQPHETPFLSPTKPTIFFFDGHDAGPMADVLPFLKSLGASQASVYGLHRQNGLDTTICKVKDCFDIGRGSYPVYPNGTRNHICMQRRREDLASGTDSKFKVYLHPPEARLNLTMYAPVWEQRNLKNALDSHGFTNFSKTTFEALTEYEYDSSPAALNGSAEEFAKILLSMDIVADLGLIRRHLNSGRGTLTRHRRAAEIYNLEAVRAALVGTAYAGFE